MEIEYNIAIDRSLLFAYYNNVRYNVKSLLVQNPKLVSVYDVTNDQQAQRFRQLNSVSMIHINSLLSSDVIDGEWSTLWQSREPDREKLSQFFGSFVPTDVSFSDLETYGLPAFLQSSVPLCYLMRSLLDQHCVENLFFCIEVEQFEKYDFSMDDEKQFQAALRIYDAFLEFGSDLEINADVGIREQVLDGMDEQDQYCFEVARNHILRSMQLCFVNFSSSDLYQQMKVNLQGKRTPYDETTKKEAMKVLIEYLDDSYEHCRQQDIMGYERHYKLISSLIHTFCQVRLDLDFVDIMENEQEQNNGAGSIIPIVGRDALSDADFSRLIRKNPTERPGRIPFEGYM